MDIVYSLRSPARRRACAAAALLAVLGAAERSARAVTGAELGRNTPQRHGRFEARLMFAPGDGIVSSMFLWKPGSELADTYWNEIDLEKVGSDCNGYSSNAIYGNPETQSTERLSAEADLCAAYHTHTIEWTPEYLVWRLDGIEMRRLTPSELAAFEANAPAGMQIRFNLWVGNASFGGNFQSSSLPAHQYIDWVAYSSYTPGAGEAGGDFTPLWREDFDAPLGGQWSFGTWESPLGNSVHSPANVTVSGGIGVLSLTEDGATGFAGAPPPGEPSPPAGSGGSGASGAAGAGPISGEAGATSAGGTTAMAGTSALDPSGRARSNSGCRLQPGTVRDSVGEGVLAWLGHVGLVVAIVRRRRRH